MCTAIAAFTALNIAGDVMSQTAQYYNQLVGYYGNAASANEAARLKYAKNNEERHYNDIQLTAQRLEEQRKIAQAQGTALASSQNEGNSTNLTLMDLARQGYQNISQIDLSQKYQHANSDLQRESIAAEHQSRLNSVPTPNRPNALALAISGLGHVANGALIQRQLKAKMPTSTPIGGGNGPSNLTIGQTLKQDYKDPYALGKRIRYAGN